MNKKKIAIILSILLSLTAVGGAYAYITKVGKSTSSTSIGNNTIRVQNDILNVDFVKGYKGENFNVYNNTGKVDCYIRATVSLNDTRLSSFVNYTINIDDWLLNEDGYYYYKDIVPVGSNTTPLLKTVEITDKGISDSTLKDIGIIVYTESVQSKDGSDAVSSFDSIEYNQ